jgi:hypothetical protein
MNTTQTFFVIIGGSWVVLMLGAIVFFLREPNPPEDGDDEDVWVERGDYTGWGR